MTVLPWTLRPLVGLDLETTHLDVETARIVTGSVVRVGGGHPTVARTWLSNLDGAEISAGATAVHRITTAYAHEHGRPAAEVVAGMVEMLSHYAAQPHPIVVMNAPFDLTILERECARHGVRSLWDATPVVLDPYVLDRHLDQYRSGKRTLLDLCLHYGVRVEGSAHTSEVDAKAACGVTRKIGKRWPWVGKEDIGELHELQAHWAREQREERRSWRMETFGESDETPWDWPFTPAPAEAGT
jgi:DNA polymerase-3 subunit epsilon